MDGPGRLLTTRETLSEDKRNSPGGASEAVNNSAGCNMEVVYNMRISDGGAREVGNRKRNSD